MAFDLKSDFGRVADEIVDLAIGTGRVAGLVAMFQIDGETVYARSAGVMDVATSHPMEMDSIFRLASMTKPIVSALALGLVEEGILSLDAPVTQWLPAFRPALPDGTRPEINLQHLLTHTAGLEYGFDDTRDIYLRAGVSNGLDCPGMGLEEAMERLASVPLVFAPGRGWLYSLGLDVVGAVIEAACKAPLPEVVKQRILDPLHMNDTGFEVVDRARLVSPHVNDRPGARLLCEGEAVPNWQGRIRFSPERAFVPASYPSGGAGMIGTAPDFMRFLECLRQGGAPILGGDGHDMMFRPALPPGVSIGLSGWDYSLGGQVLGEAAKARTVHETGTLTGSGAYGHYYCLDPERRLTMVWMTNTAFEGCDGPTIHLMRDALYHALSRPAVA